MESLPGKIGRIIRKLRTEKGFSQEGFAHAVGVHRTYMGMTERGTANLSIEKLQRMAKTLNVSVSELIAQAERE